MTQRKLHSLLFLLLLGFCAKPALAESITGSTVSGSLFFSTDTVDNEFALENGGSGSTAALGPGVEFTYSDSYNTDTADFSATGLLIADAVSVNAAPFSMVFTDPAFTGFSQLTDASGFTYSFTGDALTVNFAGTLTPGTYETTFNYAAVAATPEPSSALLLVTGAGVLLVGRRYRAEAC